MPKEGGGRKQRGQCRGQDDSLGKTMVTAVRVGSSQTGLYSGGTVMSQLSTVQHHGLLSGEPKHHSSDNKYGGLTLIPPKPSQLQPSPPHPGSN